jgi:class 3 adenylate cyclase
MMDGSMVFFTRPVSAIMLGLALLSFALPLYAAWKENKEKFPGASAQA